MQQRNCLYNSRSLPFPVNLPASSPFVPIARWILDWFVRLSRRHGDECARISVLDPDNSPEPAILSQRYPPGARHRIEFPCAFPSKRYARFCRFAVDVGQQREHSESVSITCQRNQGSAQDIKIVIHPLRGFNDPPPSLIFGWDFILHCCFLVGAAANSCLSICCEIARSAPPCAQ